MTSAIASSPVGTWKETVDMSVSKMLAQFVDETAGADEYARCADEDAPHAQMYGQMAKAEVEHAKMLRQAIEEELQQGSASDEAGRAARYDELAEGIMSMLGERLEETGAAL